MAVQIIAHAPQARCYECGTTEVETVCHHCCKTICREHGAKKSDRVGKPLSVEFARIGLNESNCPESPVHCEECAHIVRAPSYFLIVSGALVALGSLLLLSNNVGSGVAGVLLGCGLAAFGIYTNKQRNVESLLRQPDLPLIPHIDEMQLREKVLSRIILDGDGSYHVKSTPVKCRLTVKATFGEPDRSRLQKYREKYKLVDDEDITFHTGFIVLKGCAGLISADGGKTPGQSETVIPMTGRISKQPFFSETENTGTCKWHFSRQYKLLEKPEADSLSVHLIPSLVQESAQQTLQFDLRWTDPNPDAKESSIHRIELLELNVPVDWGEIEGFPPAKVGRSPEKGNEDGMVRRIRWDRRSLDELERKECRSTFFARFDTGIDLTDVIRGRVKLSFQNTLSGVTNVDLYYPLGWQRESGLADIKTVIIATFELSLAGLRYQDVRIVPDPKKDTDRNRQETVTFEGVIPDHTTVIALTNAMNDEGFYVKNVMENPPHTGERSKVTNRYWDIGGRMYESVYPIDFHLILTGKEIYGGDIRAEGGTTRTTLTVQGTYANPEMEERIENVWQQLNELISDVLQRLRRSDSATVQTPDQPRTDPPPVTSREATPKHTNTERAAELRKLIDRLVEALITGRISEKVFLELNAKYEQELNELQAGN